MDQKTINQHNFCYQCSKYGTDLLVGNLRIRNIKDESFPPAKKSISCEYKTRKRFRKNNEIKRRRLNMNKHKAMGITEYIFKLMKIYL